MSIFDEIMADPKLRILVSTARDTPNVPRFARLAGGRPLTEIELKLRQRRYARKSYWRHHPQVDETLYAPPLFD